MLNSNVSSAIQFPITHRTAYTPTLAAGVTNIAVNSAYWWRVDQHMFIELNLLLSGAGGANQTFSFALPSIGGAQALIDTSVLAGGASTTAAGQSQLGSGYWFIQGSGWAFIFPTFLSTSTIMAVNNTQVLNCNQFNNGDAVKINAVVPIVGW